MEEINRNYLGVYNTISFPRLNIGKYSKRPNVAKALFEYIFYHENSIREAMELASQALQASKYEDWYWKVQLGKCYFRLGMFRDSEKMFKVIRNLNFF